jgi:hypothetical protein
LRLGYGPPVRRLGLVVVVLAGCSYQGREPGIGDDDDGGDADAALATPDAVPTGDRDGDGIDDADDNCLDTANPDQANEDGDPTGNACDLCPQHAAEQVDADSDGVGDDCDPNPETGGDELLLFDGFTGNTLAPAWSVIETGGSGSWSVAGGELTIAVGEPAGIAVRQVGAPGDRLVVEALAHIVAVGPGATRSVALLADAEASPLAFDFCAVSFDSEEIELYRYDSGLWDPVEAMPIATPLGVYTLRSRTTSGVMCTVNTNQLTTMAGAGTGDHVGFRVRNASVRFAYIAVYRSP